MFRRARPAGAEATSAGTAADTAAAQVRVDKRSWAAMSERLRQQRPETRPFADPDEIDFRPPIPQAGSVPVTEAAGLPAAASHGAGPADAASAPAVRRVPDEPGHVNGVLSGAGRSGAGGGRARLRPQAARGLASGRERVDQRAARPRHLGGRVGGLGGARCRRRGACRDRRDGPPAGRPHAQLRHHHDAQGRRPARHRAEPGGHRGQAARRDGGRQRPLPARRLEPSGARQPDPHGEPRRAARGVRAAGPADRAARHPAPGLRPAGLRDHRQPARQAFRRARHHGRRQVLLGDRDPAGDPRGQSAWPHHHARPAQRVCPGVRRAGRAAQSGQPQAALLAAQLRGDRRGPGQQGFARARLRRVRRSCAARSSTPGAAPTATAPTPTTSRSTRPPRTGCPSSCG